MKKVILILISIIASHAHLLAVDYTQAESTTGSISTDEVYDNIVIGNNAELTITKGSSSSVTYISVTIGNNGKLTLEAGITVTISSDGTFDNKGTITIPDNPEVSHLIVKGDLIKNGGGGTTAYVTGGGNLTVEGEIKGSGTINTDGVNLITDQKVSLSVGNASIEEGTSTTIIVTLDGVHISVVEAEIEITGVTETNDYTVTSTTISIPIGDLNNSVTFESVENTDFYGTKVATIDIISVTNALEDGTQQETITITDDENGWTGANSTEWSTIGNWYLNSVPGSTEVANIPENVASGNWPVISTDVTIDELNIADGGKVTIGAGKSLTVTTVNNATGTGGIVLVSSGGATGSYIGPSTLGTVEITMQGNGWHHISAPVSGATTDMLNAGRVEYYTDNINVGQHWGYGFKATSGAMASGVGYAAVYSSEPGKITYTGTLLEEFTSGVVVSNANKNPSGEQGPANAAKKRADGWNLIGNPFPCGLNASELINNNGIIDNTGFDDIYLLGGGHFYNSYSDYDTKNAASNFTIGVGQAFFVWASSGGTVSFDKDWREGGSSTFYKSTKINEHIKLTLTNTKYRNFTDIHFIEGMTDGFDRKYDSYKMEGDKNISFYSMIDDDKMVIQSLPTISDNTPSKAIPLGYYIKESGIWTIELTETDNLQNVEKIILEDKLYNTFTDLSFYKTYEFKSNAGRFNDRFVIHTYKDNIVNENKSVNTLIENSISDRIDIYSYSKDIYIKMPQLENYIVSVYNISGKRIIHKNMNGQFEKINMDEFSGFFIVRIITDNQKYEKKILIK